MDEQQAQPVTKPKATTESKPKVKKKINYKLWAGGIILAAIVASGWMIALKAADADSTRLMIFAGVATLGAGFAMISRRPSMPVGIALVLTALAPSYFYYLNLAVAAIGLVLVLRGLVKRRKIQEKLHPKPPKAPKAAPAPKPDASDA